MDFQIWAHVEEIKLRGTYVNMSVDVDFILAMVIAEVYKYNQDEIRSVRMPDDKPGKKHHKLTLFEKIHVCKKGLEKYQPNLYSQYESDLNILDVLREWRNLFAHQRMIFKDEVTVTFVDIVEDFKTYSVDQDVKKLWQDLLTYRESVMNLLTPCKLY